MAELSVDIRCYCHGLGDCLLVRLPKADGSPFWMLIDCGIHTAAKDGGDKMRAVVADIAGHALGADGNPRLDVIVGTHEHIDHLSGFLQAAALFEGFSVGEVWFSWAEDPADPDARKLDRFKTDAASALAAAALGLAAAGEKESAKGIGELLGFVFGVKGERVRQAREAARALGKTVRHLKPGTLAPLPQVPGVRAYVLGPPRDPKLLGIEDILSETYAFGGAPLSVASLANGLALNEATLSIDDDPAAPFDGAVGMRLDALVAGRWGEDGAVSAFFWDQYLGPDTAGRSQAYRRVDSDWLMPSVDLALQLDGRTNNTSLVLALEIVETGRVLLFAADAQVGNWLSWDKVTFPATDDGPARSADDLIRRTVFYKVGHHGSRNATRAATLERMDHANLVAFSPTDESLAGRVGWKDFPAPGTSARIGELTSGRFIQSDADWIREGADPPIECGGALLDIKCKAGLYVDLKIG